MIGHQVIVQLIAATTTKTGVKARCELDPNSYPAAIKIADADMAAIKLHHREFHGDWDYRISPRNDP